MPAIDIGFELCRSISSRLLWDVGPGGLLVDGGRLSASPVCGVENLWRITEHKTLLWTDREPYAVGAGSGFGNALNYLAPATATWWLETEMYDRRSTPNSP